MKRNLFILATCMMAAMSACTHDEEPIAEIEGKPTDNVIRVTTDVAPSVTATVTRAGYETSNLEEFGFFVNNTVSEDFTYNNIRMNRTEEGEWKASIEEEMYWMSRLVPVTVLAYAPYQEGEYTTSSQVQANVLADQSTAENLLASDFIGMKNDNFMPKTGEGGNLTEDGKVALSMKHLMSKICLSIEYPKKYNSTDGSNPVTDLKLNGIRLNAICDFSAWKTDDISSAIVVDMESSNDVEIIPFEADFTEDPNGEGGLATYECIIVPQTVGCLAVDFTLGGINYPWRYEVLEFKAGSMYKINLKIIGRKVELSSNVAVDDWEGGEGDMTEGLEAQ